MRAKEYYKKYGKRIESGDTLNKFFVRDGGVVKSLIRKNKIFPIMRLQAEKSVNGGIVTFFFEKRKRQELTFRL